MTDFRTQLLSSWRKPSMLTALLLPFSLVYALLMAFRKLAYHVGLLKVYKAPAAVVVVGNLTVGGSGKTPLVIYLVQALQQAGLSPGVISRGYGGAGDDDSGRFPLRVTNSTPARQCGDEAALIVRRTGAPMVVGPNREEAIRHLLNHAQCDVIISDDGLQHYALARDVEICVLDHTVAGDNAYLLPAGPNREPRSRLKSVDFVVCHQSPDAGVAVGQDSDTIEMRLEPGTPQPLLERHGGTTWSAAETVHAVAAIGQPQRFFDSCTRMGLQIIPHAFPDHHQFTAADILFDDEWPVLMTEKDAVKCGQIASVKHWYLPVDVKLNQPLADQLLDHLRSKGRLLESAGRNEH